MIALTQNRTARLAAWIRLGFHLQNPWSYVVVLATLVLGLTPFFQGAIAQAASPESLEAELISEAQSATSLPEDGVFLYGQSPQPEELGAGYMVFESFQNYVVGALYMPYSSFDCFQGQLNNGELAMTITNSYTQESYPYAVALQSTDAIASASGGASPLQLEGFHQLEAPSENDLNILATCKANLQNVSDL